MEGIVYGYVRVSTHEQNEARQVAAMQKFGVAEENIIVEKLSGKDFCRPLYQRLAQRLRPGDVLVVKSIDRLGRNYTEILEQWGMVAQTERDNIRQRQAEGIAEAMERGVRFGRRPLDLTEDFRRTALLWQDGMISSRKAALKLGISHQTFLRRVKQM